MHTRRQSMLLRMLLWGGSLWYALVTPCAAQEKPSRDYPPTYSSRKAPWYDVTTWFSSDSSGERREVKPSTVEPREVQPTRAAPAWQWYGYGAPTPGNNPLAPQGTYEHVPLSWHQVVGSTPGAMPLAQLRGAPTTYLDSTRELPPDRPNLQPVLPPPQPLPNMSTPTNTTVAPPTKPTAPPPPGKRKLILPDGQPPYPLVRVPTDLPEKPTNTGDPTLILPSPLSSPNTDVSSGGAAKLALPKAPVRVETVPTNDVPRASLKPPVPVDERIKPAPAPRITEQTAPPTDASKSEPTVSVRPAPPPGFALPSVDPGTPDIPVNPAMGIRPPQ